MGEREPEKIQPLLFDGSLARILEEGISQELVGSNEPGSKLNLGYVESRYGRRTASVLRAAIDRAIERTKK